MKHLKTTMFSFLTTGLALTVGLLGATKSGTIEPAKASGTVAISKADDGGWNPFGWGTHGVSTSGLTDSIGANNEANLWSSDFINLQKHDNCDLEFSFDSYDSTDDNLGNWGDGLDFYIKSADNNTTYLILRVWSDAWGKHNGTHSTCVYSGDWNTSTENGDDFNEIGGGGHTNVISGDAASNSSFNLRLDKEHGLSFKNSWGSYSYCTKTEITGALATAISQNTALSIVIGAQGGFARNTVVTLKSYNGQSFANDGVNFTDNMGPEVITSNGGDMAKYSPLGKVAVSCWDVFSGDCQVSEKKADGTAFTNSDVYFNSLGEHTLSFTSVDGLGNSSTRDATYNVTNPTAVSMNDWMMAEHASDYQCAQKYSDAKNMFKGLDTTERSNFENEAGVAEGRARYVAWCTANGDLNPFDGGDPVASLPIYKSLINNDNSSVVIITALVAIASISVLGMLIVLKRRKHN